jgi:serine/threonine-protein kinase
MTPLNLPNGTFEYDPLQPLGNAGGFGQVFLGRASSGEEIAVKKLHLSAADAAHRELAVADELKGRAFEHVIPFIDAGEDADTGDYFVVMPKAEGSLQNKLTKNVPLSPLEAADVLLQITAGLLEVGDLVHRDLKPDNVLFHHSKWKIADFGIARFVEEATASNTLKDCLSPWYAAPEQWRSERATHATDVYALGCIAFCLLAGKPPFTSNPQAEHQNAPLPHFVCSEPRLTTLVQMCLRKTAASRPSLTRLRVILSDIINKPQLTIGGGSLIDLATAAAHVSTKEQEVQARLAKEKAEREERAALAKSGFEILADNIERLWGKIHSQAPNAQRTTGYGASAFKFQIGTAELVINLSKSNILEPGLFRHSGWDVVGFSQILVSQDQPPYCWSASLWFVRMKGQTEYRWHEASYFRMFMHSSQFEPYSEPPGEHADMTASNITCGTQFAFGPIEIDDEKEDDFHDRWIQLLSRAATGRLHRPSTMPFSWPPFR